MRIVIVGCTGQLGNALMHLAGKRYGEAVGVCRPLYDVTRPTEIAGIIRDENPDAVVNCTAFHDLRACEDNPEEAVRVNTLWPRYLGEICERNKCIAVHISTDYVFDGTGGVWGAYDENDKPAPLQNYGLTKYHGERQLAKTCAKHYILRTASLYGGICRTKPDFVGRVLAKATAGEPARYVSDVVMSPTRVYDLAAAVLHLLDARAPYGVYHAANVGAVSWYDFAREIARLGGCSAEITPCLQEDFPEPFARPRFTPLWCDKLAVTGFALRRWEEALAEYLGGKPNGG